jgi:hypothetical protein
MKIAKCKMQNENCKMKIAKCKMQNAKCKMRSANCEGGDAPRVLGVNAFSRPDPVRRGKGGPHRRTNMQCKLRL